ncbi:MAG: BON domain-containing protein [Myxococcota bacterium]
MLENDAQLTRMSPPVLTRDELVAVVCSQERRPMLLQALDSLEYRKQWFPSVSALPADHIALAAVVIESAKPKVTASDIKKINDNWPDAPLISVVPEDVRYDSVVTLFEHGASGVVAWPDEAFLLAPITVSLMAVAPEMGERKSESDVSQKLEWHVESRIDLQLDVQDIDVSVDGAGCRVEGRVPTLGAKMELISLVETVPGVKDVQAHSLVVDAPDINEDTFEKMVHSAIHLEHALSSSSVHATTHAGGHVTLGGSVVNQLDRSRIKRAVANVPGVRCIYDLMTVTELV